MSVVTAANRFQAKAVGWKPRSFAWHLGTMALGLIVPALVFFAVLLYQSASAERARIESDARFMARILSLSVGQLANEHITTLQALSTTPSLKKGDLA